MYRRLDTRYRVGDVCAKPIARPGAFDLAVDGHCLHCIIEAADRKAFFENARRALRPGGILIVMSMCGPVHRSFAQTHKGQKAIAGTLYARTDAAREFRGARLVDGKWHMPTRRVPHWKSILVEIRAAGLEARLVRVCAATAEDPTGDVCVAAVKG